MGQKISTFTSTTFSKDIKAIAFSPDGKFIAVGCGKKIYVSSMMNSIFEWVPMICHSGTVTSVAWAPDSKTIASTSRDNTTIIWDVKYNFRLFTIGGLENWSSCVKWSSDGKKIAVSSWDKEKPIQILDPIGGECLMTLVNEIKQEKPLCVFSLDWSPDNQLLASGSHDNTVSLWDTNKGILLKTLEGHTGWINSVVWSPNGRFLASGSKDNTVRVWDMKTFNCERILEGHSNSVKALVWAPDSITLASGSVDETIRFWNTKTGDEEYLIDNFPYGISSIAFSSNGNTFAIANGHTLKQIQLPSYQKVLQDVIQRKRKVDEKTADVEPQKKKARHI